MSPPPDVPGLAEAGPVAIEGLEGFRRLIGRTLGPSAAVEITQARIDDFCRAVDNREWTHWDEERCGRSRFGTTIAPAAFVQALFPVQWHSLAAVRGLKSVVIAGSDRFRLLQPLRRGTVLVLYASVAEVQSRESGVAIGLDLQWRTAPGDTVVAVARHVLRAGAEASPPG